MNRVIAAADTKSGLVLAAQGAVLAATAASMRPGTVVAALSRTGAALTLVLATLVVFLLAAALWPRVGGPAPRWFAFPSFPAGEAVPARPDAAVLALRAWAQAAALADIARRKFRWFRVALIVGAVEVTAFVLWVTLGAGTASTT